MSELLLYSRSEHGSIPVQVVLPPRGHKKVKKKFRVGSWEFQSTRSLLVFLTKHPNGRNWTFDRYFRRGRFQKEEIQEQSVILELFGSTAKGAKKGTNDRFMNLPRGQGAPNVVRGTIGIGVDLQKRHEEVRKLFYAGYSNRVHKYGYDPDDVLQEIFRGILIRNRGKCPYDPAKSTFGHYVHMVCGCILSNYHRKQTRIRLTEQVGMRGPSKDGDGGAVSGDARSIGSNLLSLSCTNDVDELLESQDFVITMSEEISDTDELELCIQAFPHVISGIGRAELAVLLGGIPLGKTTRVMKAIRAVAEKIGGQVCTGPNSQTV